MPRSSQVSERLKAFLQHLSLEDQSFIVTLIERDPLAGVFKHVFGPYILALCFFLLWPFDFMFPVKNGLGWVDGRKGIAFPKQGQALSRKPSISLCRGLLSGEGLTVEVWIATEKNDQTGPARIVSYSTDAGRRNFTLGQDGSDLVMRLRTTKTDLNGVEPHLKLSDVFNASQPIHIVIAYDFQIQEVYVNGQRRVRANIPGGRFSNWDDTYPLVLGNEATGGRPWLGKIFYLAIYNRPLEEEEVRRHYQSGWEVEKIGSQKNKTPQETNPIARYIFLEGEGSKIHDTGQGGRVPLDLYIPDRINVPRGQYLARSYYPEFGKSSPSLKMSGYRDFLLNILAFIPIGFLAHGLMRQYFLPTTKISIAILTVGFFLSFSIESLQYFSVTRNSSSVDLMNNVVGTALGIWLGRRYAGRLKAYTNDVGLRQV